MKPPQPGARRTHLLYCDPVSVRIVVPGRLCQAADDICHESDTQIPLGYRCLGDINMAYRLGRGIKAGRVWTNCYHAYPAHAAFGGYKKSGIGRETHKMMLDLVPGRGASFSLEAPLNKRFLIRSSLCAVDGSPG